MMNQFQHLAALVDLHCSAESCIEPHLQLPHGKNSTLPSPLDRNKPNFGIVFLIDLFLINFPAHHEFR